MRQPDVDSSVAGSTWSKTPGKLWKVGETAEGGARENPVFPPFLRLAAASIRRCCTCVPGVFDQMRRHGGADAVPDDGEAGRVNAQILGVGDDVLGGRVGLLDGGRVLRLGGAVVVDED